ncbi:MAG: Gfo/Idh/MocA family oxidoreductase, partial [Geminicoccaceae bacterium]
MISAFHLRAWQSLGDRVAVVAISDPHHERAAQRAGEFSIPAVHADPAAMLASERLDVVDIASPRETHVELVEAAAARGIAVLCQKPLAPTL